MVKMVSLKRTKAEREEKKTLKRADSGKKEKEPAEGKY
jgi:hypothetical protein